MYFRSDQPTKKSKADSPSAFLFLGPLALWPEKRGQIMIGRESWRKMHSFVAPTDYAQYSLITPLLNVYHNWTIHIVHIVSAIIYLEEEKLSKVQKKVLQLSPNCC